MAREITPEELAKRRKAGAPLLLVDVREDWEREIARIEGDVHIPMDAVPERVAEFRTPAGGGIVVYCHGGVRSLRVAAFLEKPVDLRTFRQVIAKALEPPASAT